TNFYGLRVHDATPAHRDGLMMGNATVVEAERPVGPQPMARENVLYFDGTNSYAVLPADAFIGLTNATVEGWVKWDRLGKDMVFFDFGLPGANHSELFVQQAGSSAALIAGVESRKGSGRFGVDNVLVPGVWMHVALVTGTQGVKLYLNGALAATDPFTGSFNV